MKKFNVKKFIIFIVICALILFLLVGGIFLFLTTSTGKETEKKEFLVEEGESFSTIIDDLKENDLIRSELVFKIMLKIKNPTNLDAGVFYLNRGMNNFEIIDALSKRNLNNPNAITVTIPEGKHITDIASILADNTNNTKDDYLNVWNSSEYIDKVIGKYWFITEEIKKEGIRYPLEGYFFSSTYEFQNKDVTPEEVGYVLLDQMEKILNEYKNDINESKYNVHELLTMASIVEYEAILDEDRAIISGIFYKRIDEGMKLQSCATVGYAINEWKLSYNSSDLNVDSPYNTYYYGGLPIGPASSPSEESIKASIYPEESEYYYFLADVCSENPKTYFSKTLSEHEQKSRKYLTCY